MKKLLLIAGILLLYVGLKDSLGQLPASPVNGVAESQKLPFQQKLANNLAIENQAIQAAFNRHESDVQIEGRGIVTRLLSDDDEGAQHQKFIIQVNPDQTLLVAHNIDLAPRISALAEGDEIAFSGEYEWNSKGGILHWTHLDPQGQHAGGWIRHNGQTYQ